MNSFLFLALPTQPKQMSEGTSTGSNKVANLNVTRNKYESYDLQASKKSFTNQDNARVGTSKKPHDQKISGNIGESTTKKIYAQKISGSKTTEKPKKQIISSSNNSSNSSNKNNSTNISNNNRNSNTSDVNFSRVNISSNNSNNTSSINSSKSSNTSSINSSNSSNASSIDRSSIRGSNTNSNASIAKAMKISLLTEDMDITDLSDLNSTNVVIKRSSTTKLLTAEMENSSKPLQIEVKAYTAPPNASAIIEVRPKTSESYEIDPLNYPDQYLWPLYQHPYPQEMNGLQYWYKQQYQPSLPPSLTYVPTEELLHSQNFSNNPGFSSQLLYQYPVKEAVFKKQIFSRRPKYLFSNLVKNQTKVPKPDPKDGHKVLPNYAVEPLAQISPYQIHMPPQKQYYLPQDYFPPNFLPHTNENQNSFYTQYQPNLNNKPVVTTYVTKSFVLKTHPKLEWVPL